MNLPQDAIKDRFEHDPDFCYDCCKPKDECICVEEEYSCPTCGKYDDCECPERD